MSKKIVPINMFLFDIILLTIFATLANAEDFNVYGPVPGLEPSPFYNVKIRKHGSEDWIETFVLHTECTEAKKCNAVNRGGFFDHLGNWSNSYVNFEMEDGTQLDLEITMLFGNQTITKAVVHPQTASDDCKVENGKAYITVSHPGLFAVDINGQMDDQDTGKLPKNKGLYNGPPIHTITIFANPFLENKPSLDDPGVFKLQPGEKAPTNGDWHTLYFMPGLHDIGISYIVMKNKTYYIPGDAVVYGTFNNAKQWNARNVLIYGHGTISGDKLPHPGSANPPVPEAERYTYSPISLDGAKGTRIEGITIANSAFHSLGATDGYNPDEPILIRWVKIFTWRPNGDGIANLGNEIVEDCFIRTQDDSLYIASRAIRRVVLWNDSNGSAWVLSHIGWERLNTHELEVEDCTVIYSRASWHHWSGGNIFNMRGEGSGDGGYSLIFRNIKVEDPRPTLQPFKILMEVDEPYGNRKRKAGDLHGIVFENVTIASSSVLDEPDILWGMSDGLIYNLVFRNVYIGDEQIESVDHFMHNEYVHDKKPNY